jgi:hypothetical protein
LLVKELTMCDLCLVARVAKDHYPTRRNDLVEPLQKALVFCIAGATVHEMQQVTVEDCNNMFLDEKWLDDCVKYVLDDAPHRRLHI